MIDYDTDVLVIGGGMAALCAAISAREAGARVLLVEAASRELRGGNTRHSRNLRIMHDAPTALIPGSYGADEFLAELARASEGKVDPVLGRVLVQGSASLPEWLEARGAVFQTEHIAFSRRTAFFLGGGKTAINALYATAERLLATILYGHRVDAVDCATCRAGRLQARAIVACCGGAQALSQSFINRGTPFARGEVLHSLFSQGACEAGRADAAHVVAVDGRFDAPDGGIVTRVDGMEHGIVVDCAGNRIVDETSVTGPTRYARWGQIVAALPEKRAALVLDATGIGKIPDFVFAPLQAASLAELARALSSSFHPIALQPAQPAPLASACVREDGPFRDADAPRGAWAREGEIDRLALEKSAEASGRVATPPFFAFPIRPGITFSCHGVKVDEKARLVGRGGEVFSGIFAGGMIMAPSVLGTGYLAGCGMTIGAVFGRIAGEEAARYALG